MKKLVLILFCAALFSCSSSAAKRSEEQAQAGARQAAAAADLEYITDFSQAQGRDWLLSEIRSGGRTIYLDREKLRLEGFYGVFTIHFQDGHASGMGAPNRFFGPYTVGANQSLGFGNLASTMMAAFMEPDELKEHEFFNFLSRVNRWDFRYGQLELFSRADNGAELVLVFN